jgi:hypothetical protein
LAVPIKKARRAVVPCERVLVERVEGLARPKEWRRAYNEINAFEKMLVDDGVRLVKLFLHISDEEQLRRFRERITTPTKHWKINAEDIRNRAHRPDYLAALDDMFALTSTAAAPWYVVPAEYKWFARVALAKTVVKALGKELALGPLPSTRKSSKPPQKSWAARRGRHSASRSPSLRKAELRDPSNSGTTQNGFSPRAKSGWAQSIIDKFVIMEQTIKKSICYRIYVVFTQGVRSCNAHGRVRPPHGRIELDTCRNHYDS